LAVYVVVAVVLMVVLSAFASSYFSPVHLLGPADCSKASYTVVKVGETATVISMDANSTVCVQVTYTVVNNLSPANFTSAFPEGVAFFGTLPIVDSNGPAKAFQTAANPASYNISSLPTGFSFNVNYTLMSLADATGYYALQCWGYLLAVGHGNGPFSPTNFGVLSATGVCPVVEFFVSSVAVSGAGFSYLAKA
jgi:hypothetical protein